MCTTVSPIEKRMEKRREKSFVGNKDQIPHLRRNRRIVRSINNKKSLQYILTEFVNNMWLLSDSKNWFKHNRLGTVCYGDY